MSSLFQNIKDISMTWRDPFGGILPLLYCNIWTSKYSCSKKNHLILYENQHSYLSKNYSTSSQQFISTTTSCFFSSLPSTNLSSTIFWLLGTTILLGYDTKLSKKNMKQYQYQISNERS